MGIEKLTSDEIKGVWERIAPNYDHALSHEEGKKYLIEQSSGSRVFDEGITALKARQESYPDFFIQHDYGWAFLKESYDFPIELSYQVRALDAVIGLWRSQYGNHEFNAKFERIVARATYLSKFSEATPFACQENRINFIVVPLAWTEFIHMFFCSLTAFFGVKERHQGNITSAWNICLNRTERIDKEEACRYWKAMFANLVASDVCEYDIKMPSVVSGIIEGIPYFRDAIKELTDTVDFPLSNDLSYLSNELAIAHEVAHIFSGDLIAGAIPDEVSADYLGLGAFINGWGWRSSLLGGAELSDVGKIVMGTSAFNYSIRSLCYIRTILASLDTNEPFLSRWMESVNEELENRALSLAGNMDKYLSLLISQNAWENRKNDEDIIRKFHLNYDEFMQEMIAYFKAFSSELVTSTYSLASNLDKDEL